MSTPVGHFHGDDEVVGKCCCPTYEACADLRRQWEFYPTDVAACYAPGVCDRCGVPTCTPQQLRSARLWFDLYG